MRTTLSLIESAGASGVLVQGDVAGLAGEMATRIRYTGACVFHWRTDSGESSGAAGADYWDFLFTERADG
jgi:hypothetical protein